MATFESERVKTWRRDNPQRHRANQLAALERIKGRRVAHRLDNPHLYHQLPNGKWRKKTVRTKPSMTVEEKKRKKKEYEQSNQWKEKHRFHALRHFRKKRLRKLIESGAPQEQIDWAQASYNELTP